MVDKVKKNLPPDFNGVIFVIMDKADHHSYEKGDVITVWPHTHEPSKKELNNKDWRLIYVDGMTMADAQEYLDPLVEIDGRTIVEKFRRKLKFKVSELDKDKIKDKIKDEFVKSEIDLMKDIKQIPLLEVPMPEVIP